MPSSVAEVFAAAGLRPVGVGRWGERISVDEPGVYVVALTDQSQRINGTPSECPLSRDALAELLRVRPELCVDDIRPSADALCARLATLWLADEAIVYIGRAGTSLRDRVGAYYKTPLGARRLHAGGWPLKTLSVLAELWVHYAPCLDPGTAELAMLDAFIGGVSASSRAALHDADLPLPFANLERSKPERQRHGITGAREPQERNEPTERTKPVHAASTSSRADAERSSSAGAGRADSAQPASLPMRAPAPVSHAGAMRSQRVTEKDIEAGRIRFPSSANPAFPRERGEVEVVLRGLPLTARWHPHYDRDQERSGVLSVGRQALGRRVSPEEVLAVTADGDSVSLT